jgi:hypothetical protein
MIKDIVVKLSVGERASPAEDYALSIAATFAAHITGIGFRYYPIVQVAGAPYTSPTTSTVRVSPPATSPLK